MNDTTLETAPPSAAAGGDPLAGTPYRFIRRIGEGGMGEVVEAEHLTLGSHVAVKLLHPQHVMRFELKDRMRIEAQACARLRHDNLVHVLDYGETDDCRAYIAMELLSGCALVDELSARGALPVTEAIDIASQALAGLRVAHAAGLVHRDVKPDNLFLCQSSEGRRRVKVLDFGIAKIVDAGRDPRTPLPLMQPTAEGYTVGTPRYASPEQARGDRDIDARSDLYSTGWVLYAMLTGRAPFAEHRSNAALWRAYEHEIPLPPSAVAPQPISPDVDRIVMRALAKHREDRFPDAEAFRVELLRVDASLRAPVPSAVSASAASAPRTWRGTAIIDSQAAAALRADPAQARPAALPATMELAPTHARMAPLPKTVELGMTPATLVSPGSKANFLVPGETLDVVGDTGARAVLPWRTTAPAQPEQSGARSRLWLVGAMLLVVGGLAVVLLRVLGLL